MRPWALAVGLFLFVWGSWELARQLGWIQSSFQVWPAVLIFIGLALVLGAFAKPAWRVYGWQDWQRRGGPPGGQPPQGPG